MRVLRLVAAGSAVVVGVGCGNAPGALAPTVPTRSAQVQSPSESASRRVETSGHFDAIVDFSTLTLTPRGQNCLLTVKGRLVFSGTIDGVATGQTNALVSAPCADVASAPPGTYPDVFHSELTFEGTVDGEPATAKGLYMGRSQPGGHISGRFVLSNGVSGVLDVEAQIAVGGEYQGSVVVH